MTPRRKANLIASFAADKKAEDIVLVDLRNISDIADYFVICSAQSDRKMKAVADGITEGAKGKGWTAHHIEGYRDKAWILIDYGNIVAHIFYSAARGFYNLERLWGDAPRVKFR